MLHAFRTVNENIIYQSQRYKRKLKEVFYEEKGNGCVKKFKENKYCFYAEDIFRALILDIQYKSKKDMSLNLFVFKNKLIWHSNLIDIT